MNCYSYNLNRNRHVVLQVFTLKGHFNVASRQFSPKFRIRVENRTIISNNFGKSVCICAVLEIVGPRGINFVSPWYMLTARFQIRFKECISSFFGQKLDEIRINREKFGSVMIFGYFSRQKDFEFARWRFRRQNIRAENRQVLK